MSTQETDNGSSQAQEGQQDDGKGEEGSGAEKISEGDQVHWHAIRQQGREGPGTDEAQGRRDPRRYCEGDRWQNHSIRGFVSGHVTKKLGLKVESTKSEAGERTYRVVS
jgi:hypothetical protein